MARPVTITILAACLTLPALAGSFTGALGQDSDMRAVFFTMSAPGIVILQTFSYGGGTNSADETVEPGGFDPTISVFDSNGNLVALNRDGGCGLVNADPVTSFCWDSFLELPLPAGNYRLVLTEGDNLPRGPTLADSFVYAGLGNFTAISGIGPSFLDSFPSQRTPVYALDILGTDAAFVTTITSSSVLPNASVGQSYHYAFAAISGPGVNLSWSVAPGSQLPPGLALAADGTLTGQLATAGTFTFTLQVNDGFQTTNQTVSLIVYGPITITNASLPSGFANQVYGPVNMGFNGGSGSGNWSATGLPSGLTISSSGQISGIPVVGGVFQVTISVSDATANLSASVTLSLTINVASVQITSSGSLGEFVQGANIAGTPTAAGGTSPYLWASTGLPAGFTFNPSTGAFSGLAPAPGYYNFTLTVSDSKTIPATASLSISFSVLGITTSSLPSGSTTANYAQTVNATGGTPPYSFAGLGIPSGLTLSTAGVLSGQPTTTGTFSLTVGVSDAAGLTSTSSFILVVTGATSPLAVPGGALTDASVSVLYTTNLSATGGSPPYTWTLVGGALPDGGFTVPSSGTVTGTPKTPGASTFTAQVTDSGGKTAAGTFTLKVDPAPLVLSSVASFPIGIDGSEYPDQILSASGGVAPYTFTVTGSLPPGLTFSSPQITGIPTNSGNYPFTVTLTDSSGKQVVVNTSITITPEHTDLIVSQSTVSFSLTVGSDGVPTPASIPVRSSDVTQLLNFSVTASPAVSWLDITGGGTTPGSVGLALDSSAVSLPANATPYQATVRINCLAPSPCAGGIQTINVSLLVSAPAAQISANSTLLSFTASTSNPVASSQPLGIENTGGGTLLINSVTAADSWLTVTGAPPSLAAGPAAILTVTANPANLVTGYYQSSITINSSVGSITVPVTLNLTANAVMTLSAGGAQFHTPKGNVPGATAGSFNISLTGAASANWTATVLPGADWLSVSTPGGVTTPSQAGTVNFALDPNMVSGLAVQAYYGQIQVASTTVTDSPLTFLVVLNVVPANVPPRPELSSGGITFTTTLGSGQSSAPAVQVYASSNTPIGYQASVSMTNGSGWLSVSPGTGVASAGAPGQSVISIDNTRLAAGVYQGGVSYAYSSDAVRTVNVTLIVQTGAQTSSLRSGGNGQTPATTQQASCGATKLVPTQTGLVNNFSQPAGWPTPVAIQVLDDCGAARPDSQVVLTFSNGDPPLLLNPQDTTSGMFTGTWTPSAISSQITITGTATVPVFKPASVAITGEVSPNTPPILSPHGTVHIFTTKVGVALAPGEIVAIYGSNFAPAIASSSIVPLPTSLGGTAVIIGGEKAPLYFVSPGQINAQVPFDLNAGNSYQILVQANGALSTPDSFQLGVASPEIAIYPTTGQIIAQHAADYSLVTESSPAVPGETLIFYLAGMGATDTSVASGAGSPTNPLAHPLAMPTLTLNGTAIQPGFAGLTPTAVGLYQIDFQVPSGTPAGDLPLVVSQAGVPTNMTFLPIAQSPM